MYRNGGKGMKRSEAIKTGNITYITGKSCKNGHFSPRYTSTGVCVECQKNRQQQYMEGKTRVSMMVDTGNVELIRRINNLMNSNGKVITDLHAYVKTMERG
jgi:hypothetical protein